MKNLTILLLVLFAINANCQFFKELKPISSIEIGFKQRQISLINPENRMTVCFPDLTMYSDITIGLNYDNFLLTSNIVTNFTKTGMEDYMFSPFFAEYYFDFSYTNNNFKIGFQHYCSHPVLSGDDSLDIDYNRIHEYHDKFYIKYSFN
jgi:hypothetical protein